MSESRYQRGLVRQWTLVRALQASKRPMTFPQLAAQITDETHIRTIRRDIATLADAGFPVFVSDGAKGRPSLIEWKE